MIIILSFLVSVVAFLVWERHNLKKVADQALTTGKDLLAKNRELLTMNQELLHINGEQQQIIEYWKREAGEAVPIEKIW